MIRRTRPSVLIPINDPPIIAYPDYDNSLPPTKMIGDPHSKKQEERKHGKTSKLSGIPKAGYNDPKKLQNMKYAQLLSAEYDNSFRKYAIVRSADIEMPGNLMMDGDSRLYPDGKKYEGGFFVFLDQDFPGTSDYWDSWASITGGEYDFNGKQYALTLDMSQYGYYGIRISDQYGDRTHFNFKLDYRDNDICKLYDHNGWPTLWYNTLGPKVIYSSLKQLGTLYSLNVSGGSTLNSLTCSQINCSGNIFGTDLVGTNVWADYIESSGYVYANTIEATNWIGLPSTPVSPADLLPLTLDKTQNFVGINKVNPAYDLDVYGDAHVSGFSTLNGISATNLLASGNITGDTIDAHTSLNTQEINCLGTVYCDTVNALHYLNLPVSDITPITLDKVNTRVGINKTNPAFTLDVGGDVHVSGKTYLSGDTTCIGSVTANTISAQTYLNLPPADIKPIYLDTTNNRVGINTNAPATVLDVNGETTARGSITQTTGTSSLGALTVPSIACSGNISGTLTTQAQPNITSVGTLSSLNVSGNVTIDSNTLVVDSVNNRVGINQSTPIKALDVVGEARITSGLTVDGTTLIVDSTAHTVSINGALVNAGTGSPEGIRTAPVGSLYMRTDGADGTTLYTKVTGTGNTGWQSVTTSGGVGSTTVYKNASPNAVYSPYAAANTPAFQSIISFTLSASSIYIITGACWVTKNLSSTTGANCGVRFQSSTSTTIVTDWLDFPLLTAAGANTTIMGITSAINTKAMGICPNEIVMNKSLTPITCYIGISLVSSTSGTAANMYRIDSNDCVFAVTKVGTV